MKQIQFPTQEVYYLPIYDYATNSHKMLKCNKNLYNTLKQVASDSSLKLDDSIISISKQKHNSKWFQKIFSWCKKFIFKITEKKYFENKDYLVYLGKNRR